MKHISRVILLLFFVFSVGTVFAQDAAKKWVKYENNPVLGGELGTCFDVTLLQEDGVFKMWFSWRPKKSIAYVESVDGITWTEPKIVLSPCSTGWEDNINRCSVLRRGDVYYMWYTGQTNDRSWIGFATSPDGIVWTRRFDKPVVSSEEDWEKVAVMCPDVTWDEEDGLYKMRYSAGEQYEPNAIGLATSPDGLNWTKYENNPIFTPDKSNRWEQHKVTAAQFIKLDGWYYVFYIGFENENLARVCIARSKDGVGNWERNPNNPIISPDEGKWDASACYKPYVIYDEKEDLWRLWYNGRNGGVEQIGMATLKGKDLGFDK